MTSGEVYYDKDQRFKHMRNGAPHGYLSELDKEIGVVTSRDQIIDPYSLVNINAYRRTAAGKALYNADLARAKAYSERQEAAYQEWYNSPEQIAFRERQAGRNPDLIDGALGSGEASDTQPSDTSPMEGIPTVGEQVNQGLQTFATVVSALASVASLTPSFAGIPKLKADTEGSKFLNLMNLSSALSSNIGDLLASAQQFQPDNFDLQSWFGDDKNFEPLNKMFGHLPNYEAALALSRSQMLRHASSSAELQRKYVGDTLEFAKIASDPRFSTNQKITVALMRPFTQANINLEQANISLQQAIAEFNTLYHQSRDAAGKANAENVFDSYNSEYYGASSGKLLAEFEKYMREVERSGAAMTKSINDNLKTQYDLDPFGETGISAMYLFNNRSGASLSDYYYATAIDDFISILDSDATIKEAIANNAELREGLLALSAFPDINRGTLSMMSLGLSPKASKMYQEALKEYFAKLDEIFDTE